MSTKTLARAVIDGGRADPGGYRQLERLDADYVALRRSLSDWFRACHDPSAHVGRPPPSPA